ncbi:MAG: STAS domain-containing protein [SAR324 cluster bacterium]|nr:STAS domain-containing protein [SAR324 cluster bacterium]
MISVEGNFAHQEIEELVSFMATSFDEMHPAGLILNLEQVTSIASSGLGTVKLLYQTTLQKQIGFAICQPSIVVSNVLTAVSMDQMFSIFQTEIEALEHLRQKNS